LTKPLETLIDENRQAIQAEPIRAKAVEPIRAKAVFSVSGDLVGLTEVELMARQHAVTVDEPPSLGGQDAGANPVAPG